MSDFKKYALANRAGFGMINNRFRLLNSSLRGTLEANMLRNMNFIRSVSIRSRPTSTILRFQVECRRQKAGAAAIESVILKST
jgi:hypothetical protein